MRGFVGLILVMAVLLFLKLGKFYNSVSQLAADPFRPLKSYFSWRQVCMAVKGGFREGRGWGWNGCTGRRFRSGPHNC